MSLRIIYGKAGSGKTRFCFEEIKKKINLEDKIYIITPEQFSYSAEKELLNILDENSVLNAEVISFNRIAHRIFNEVGGANKVHITKAGKAMLIDWILQEHTKNLNYLNRSNDNIEVIMNTITEMKKHEVTKEKLAEVIEKTQDINLKLKLNDIFILYKDYEDFIHNKYIDEEEILTKLADMIKQSTMFDNAIIYIDEFFGFTKQEYNILSELLKKAKQVNITVCTDELEIRNIPEIDIFYSNKEFSRKILDLANLANVEVENEIHLENLYRFKNEDLKHLEENIYNISYQKYFKEPKNIKLFLAANPYSEIEYVAKEISKLVRSGMKYSDISIITKDISRYR